MKLLIFLFLATSLIVTAGPVAPALNDDIVRDYCIASASSSSALEGSSMEVSIEASLPRLKKQGKLHALRRISALGRITYEALKFDGDGTVKNQVIARYLTAEAEVQKDQAPSIAVTPDNYKFKYKGTTLISGREAFVFEVSPKQKRTGLYKGTIWIDSVTHLRVREQGQLVKNPSIFLKRVEFTRNYEIRNGLAVPLQVVSVVRTRLVGTAELTISYSNLTVGGAQPDLQVATAGE